MGCFLIFSLNFFYKSFQSTIEYHFRPKYLLIWQILNGLSLSLQEFDSLCIENLFTNNVNINGLDFNVIIEIMIDSSPTHLAEIRKKLECKNLFRFILFSIHIQCQNHFGG